MRADGGIVLRRGSGVRWPITAKDEEGLIPQRRRGKKYKPKCLVKERKKKKIFEDFASFYAHVKQRYRWWEGGMPLIAKSARNKIFNKAMKIEL